MEPAACPFCNASLQVHFAGGKAVCSRCGEPLPSHLARISPTPEAVPEPASPKPPWTNRKIALVVFGVMLVMAAAGLTLALSTVGWRRQNDFRGAKGVSTPLTLQTDGETALGYLPESANVVASVHLAELFKDPAGKKLLETPRPPLLDLLLGTIERWTKLSPENIDTIALGTEIRGKLPQLTIAIETRRPYDPATLAKAAQLGPPAQQRGKPLFRFALMPGEGMLWCPGPTTLILLLRLDGLKMEDLDAIPLAPRQGSDAPPRAVQSILAERGNRQSLLWMAGNLDEPSLLKELVSFTQLPASEMQYVSSLRAFSIRLLSRDSLVLLGDFRLSDATASQALRTQLESIKAPNLESVKVVADPAEEWVALQIHAKAEVMRDLIGNWGNAKARTVK